MYIYKFTVKATRDRFMEPPLRDTSEHYIAAYSYDHALTHINQMLTRGGWKINSVDGKEIYLHDIRDQSDHLTD